MSESCALCRIEGKIDRMLELLGAGAARPAEAPVRPKFLRGGIQSGFPHENLRRFGCYFFALLRWVQELGARANLADDDIISIFEQCRGQMIPGTQNPIVPQRPSSTTPCGC